MFVVTKASQPSCPVKTHSSIGGCVHVYVPLGRIGTLESITTILCPILDKFVHWKVVFMFVSLLDVRYTGVVIVVVMLSEIINLQSFVVLQHIAYYNIIRLSVHYNVIQITIAF